MSLQSKIPVQPSGKPFVEITEQPSSTVRFRYECETTGGLIFGKSSTNDNRTHPTIKLHGYKGEFVVVASLVTAGDERAKPHPHALAGTDCKQEVCTKKVSGTDTAEFQGLRIQCKKKPQLKASLELRQNIHVDPFRTGFSHKEKPEVQKLDLTVVRLCFQVFLPDQSRRFRRALDPVCSDPIRNKRSADDLEIKTYVPTSSSTAGGSTMILLTGKLGSDLEVRFFEGESNNPVWEAFGEFGDKDIHQKYGIKVKIPPYNNPNNKQHAKNCFVQLRLKSNTSESSLPCSFIYHNEGDLNRNRPKKRKLKELFANASSQGVSDIPSVVPDQSLSSMDSSLSSAHSSLASTSGHQAPQSQNLTQHLNVTVRENHPVTTVVPVDTPILGGSTIPSHHGIVLNSSQHGLISNSSQHGLTSNSSQHGLASNSYQLSYLLETPEEELLLNQPLQNVVLNEPSQITTFDPTLQGLVSNETALILPPQPNTSPNVVRPGVFMLESQQNPTIHQTRHPISQPYPDLSNVHIFMATEPENSRIDRTSDSSSIPFDDLGDIDAVIQELSQSSDSQSQPGYGSQT